MNDPSESLTPGLAEFETGAPCRNKVMWSPGWAPVSQASSTDPFPRRAADGDAVLGVSGRDGGAVVVVVVVDDVVVEVAVVDDVVVAVVDDVVVVVVDDVVVDVVGGAVVVLVDVEGGAVVDGTGAAKADPMLVVIRPTIINPPPVARRTRRTVRARRRRPLTIPAPFVVYSPPGEEVNGNPDSHWSPPEPKGW